MKWDVFADDDKPQQALTALRPAGEKVDLPEGIHDLQLKRVAESDVEVVLELAHEDRRYWWAKVKAKKGQGWAKDLLRTLADSLGMSQDEWLDTPLDDLVGRRVRAEVYYKIDKGGRQWVNVGRFLPPEQPPAAPPARTPAAKVRASAPAIGSDDIPF